MSECDSTHALVSTHFIRAFLDLRFSERGWRSSEGFSGLYSGIGVRDSAKSEIMSVVHVL